jgi:N-acetylmuramoyl-L-alanine amidase
MSNEKPQEKSKGAQSVQVKRKYRLNVKKFAATMSVLCLMIAGIVIAVYFINENSDKGVVAALDPPQRTVTAGPKKSRDTSDTSEGLAGKSVVVDAGHGGFDPGTIGVSGSEEDELNLTVANYLKAELESRGADVTMTRSDENAIAETKQADMDKRGEIIRNSNSDIVVSVHMNSFKDEDVSGPLVIFMPGSDQGKTLAELIQQRLNDELEPDSEGSARSDNLFVLRAGNQPSVLVECGFISNAKEEKKLLTEDYQKKVATAICDGVEDFFSKNS